MGRNDELALILSQHRDWLASNETSGKRADLSGANLDDCDLSDTDLSGAILRGASLQRADLQHTQLIHADLHDANLHQANLSHTNLMLADFTGADLREARLTEARPSASKKLGGARQGPRFEDANLGLADLTKCYCFESQFSGANLEGVCFRGANLERANLASLNLAGLDFESANLHYAQLGASNLSGANLTGANLEHADLSEAIMIDADVSGACLKSTNLENAEVDGIKYDRKARYRGIRVASCYGSARFRRSAQDQDFIEEFKAAHPINYYVWLWLTDCGRSMLRVVLWSVGIAVCFGLIFYGLGEEAFKVSEKESLGWSPFTTIYYSVVTFTTLGFGDITPRTPLAAGLVMMEVIIGYVMLGILISILATKVARRS